MCRRAMSDLPEPANPALLPAGLRDMLPPEAEVEAASVAAVMAVFAAHGYRRVKPPLLEFEDSLFRGAGTAVSDQTLRLVDPDTHRVVGLRADITPQVARIASTRLAHAARPLRLCYAGETLRARAGLSAERQVLQAGIELIGPDTPQADAEVVLVAAEALDAIGVRLPSFDLTMPPLVQTLLDEAAGADPRRRAALAHALDRKDAAAVTAQGGALAATLTTLLHEAGPVDGALAALAAATLGRAARAQAEHLRRTVAAIRDRAPALRLTVDPVEFRGFRYHTGVCTTVYAHGRHEELGRGGRYLCGDAEPATGLTLFPDAVLRAAMPPAAQPRVYLPLGSDPALASAIRGRGFATVAALDDTDAEGAARRLECSHVLRGGVPVALGD
jgi:ATP phosphoribosyltransferase regulatory subunit